MAVSVFAHDLRTPLRSMSGFSEFLLRDSAGHLSDRVRDMLARIYGVAGAVFAPALEPALASFYWVTPIPPEWPAARADAKLREYNRYKMLALTIHEAIPGHLVQGEYANRVTPEWRRLLRSLYGSGTSSRGGRSTPST